MALSTTHAANKIVTSLRIMWHHGLNRLKCSIIKSEDSLVQKGTFIQYQQYYDTMKIPILSRRSAGSNMDIAGSNMDIVDES